jgi:hypothetical protein
MAGQRSRHHLSTHTVEKSAIYSTVVIEYASFFDKVIRDRNC